MKKLNLLLAVLLLFTAGTAVFANGDKESGGSAAYKDGVYFAQEKEYPGSGWKYFVVLTVDGGKITDAYWGGTNIQPQGDKRRMSENKTYGMVKYGNAASYWYEQAEAAEAWLLKNQDPTAMEYSDDEGRTKMLKTDGGASVSVHVIEFYTLAAEALAGAPVPAGKFKADDYVVNVKMAPSDNGWASAVDFIVANGTIVSANYNAVFMGELNDESANYFGKDKDGNPNPKSPLSKDQIKEDYGMKKFAGAQYEWYEQAEMIENYILENQAFPAVKADATTDAIAGVSIHVNELEEMFMKAFK